MNMIEANNCAFVEVDIHDDMTGPHNLVQMLESGLRVEDDNKVMIKVDDEDGTKDEDEEHICAICLEHMNTHLFEMQCNHVIHYECAELYIANAIQDKKDITCPICRALLLSSSEYTSKKEECPNDIDHHRVISLVPISTNVQRQQGQRMQPLHQISQTQLRIIRCIAYVITILIIATFLFTAYYL
jgi:hypothetical protein